MDDFDGALPKRNPVFCARIGAVLDLDRDDLGHPGLPGLWQQLLADRRPVEQRGLYCPDCRAARPDRPEWMYVYERGGLRIAAHHNPDHHRHHRSGSDAHRAYEERYVRAAESDGHPVEVGVVGADGRRRADVLVTGAGGRRYGFRPQLSYLAAGTARERDAAARADGVTPVWHTVDARAPLIDAVHWTRADDLPAAAIRDSRDLLVRGGVRALTLERCDRGPAPCPHRRSGNCARRHPRWEARGRQFDGLVRDIARGAYVPLTLRTGRGLRRFWASAADREAFLANGGVLTGPGHGPGHDSGYDAGRDPGYDSDHGPGREPEAGPERDREHGRSAGHATVPHPRYGGPRRRREAQCVLDRVEYGHRRFGPGPLRDGGEPFGPSSAVAPPSVVLLAPATVPPATVPPAAAPPGAVPARPERPAIRPLRPAVCSAGATPCEAEARLYAGGWFCEDHRPGPGFGRPAAASFGAPSALPSAEPLRDGGGREAGARE
ncbi:hypothetical protein OH807_02515 [Kitasatospora sp. NBC_01560]|uniref:hypothetical protein n=1 Tax=Kitasatospora sp. NBC_01560 TaxID=2975965 RepID=UPI00386641DA